jgi:microcystin-dependent protein
VCQLHHFAFWDFPESNLRLFLGDGWRTGTLVENGSENESIKERNIMAEPFLSEIRIFSFNFAPKGWALCNGQSLPINQNQALFSLLGTTYGGDGQTTFKLPDLRSRVPFHFNNGFVLGQAGGEENHTLVVNETPLHGHALTAALNAVVGGSANATQTSPSGNFWANSGKTCYTTAPANAAMGSGTVSTVGGQPHNNMSPFLTLNFCIALQGIFPSRN